LRHLITEEGTYKFANGSLNLQLLQQCNMNGVCVNSETMMEEPNVRVFKCHSCLVVCTIGTRSINCGKCIAHLSSSLFFLARNWCCTT